VRVRFGRCLFDGDSRELRRDGVLQALSPKAFQFLELLLSERPRALTKQEIHERLWPDSFVADSSLARLAAEVRSALGDDALSGLCRLAHGGGGRVAAGAGQHIVGRHHTHRDEHGERGADHDPPPAVRRSGRRGG
jgi:hypothetical protein